MTRARRITWKSKGGNATHITMGIFAGITITCAAFMFYVYHYHIRKGSLKQPIIIQTESSTRVEPVNLPRDTSRISSTIASTIPVNQPTRGEQTDYQQIGILTSDRKDGQDEPIIVPIYGRPTYQGSQKYQYYGASDKQHLWRIPIEVKGKDCTEEYGCDEIYQGDNVRVPTYERDFIATVYKKDNLRYIPY